MFSNTPSRLHTVLCGIVFSLAIHPAVGAGLRQLEGHVPEVVHRLAPVGMLPETNRLHLAIGLPLRNEPELDQLLHDLYDPRSPGFHRFLTPAQFTERFGPTEADYQAVIRFVRSHGLVVAGTHPNRVVLDVTGSATDIGRAFQVTLRRYQHPAEAREFFAPDVEPSVPADLAVADMWGLSDFYRPVPLAHRVEAPKASPLNYNGTGPGGSYQGRDFRNAYASGSPLIGAGQVAAVAEFDGYYANDITAYEAGCGYTNVPLQNVLVDNVSGLPGYSGVANAVAEVSLDIELIIAMAPGLSKLQVYEGSNPYNVFNKIVTDNTAKQISCSWSFGYGPNQNWAGGRPTGKTLDSQLKQMGAQGQSFFQASGDSDAYTGSQALSTTKGPIPVDSIYVTSVGGTTLSMNAGGSSWASETVWNWGGNTGSGGGISPNYGIPWWQTNVSMAANSGSTNNRNIPDVALTADAVNVIYNNGSSGAFGGTSCAAPLWAGFTALVNQQAVGSGNSPAGFLNPALYAIAASSNYTACFHDTTTGNNIGNNTPGLFYATSNYDLCTGLGTPNGTNLINALAPAPYILASPASQTATNGDNVTFKVTVGGQSPLTFAWLFNGTNLPAGGNASGTAASALTLAAVTASNAGNYSVVITNAYGAATSSVAVLTVVFPPAFSSQPTSQIVAAGGSAVFSATVTGALPLAYQWRKNGTNLLDGGNVSGSVSNVLALSAVTLADQGSYVLVASNAYGTASSSAATLTVPEPPIISVPPAPLSVQCGSNATFMVSASGTAPLHYQWSLDGAPLAGATGSSLLLTGVHLPSHTVTVVLTNLYGSATSSAPLTVSDTLPPVITLNGSNPAYTELGQAWSDPGGTASDLCAGPVPLTASGTVNTAALSTNLVTYTAADGNGNTNHATRTVIVRDTTPPVISWSFTNLVLAAGSNCTAAMPDVTGTNYILASDLSGAVTVTQTPTNNAALALGTNLVLLTVSDASGNRAHSTNWIAVEDQSPPVVVTQPQSQTSVAGASVSFSVAATACTPLEFQWFFNAVPLAGQTNTSLLVANLTFAAEGDYSVLVTSAGGSTRSQVAVLTVVYPPSFTVEPTNEVVAAGGNAVFSAAVSGTSPLAYQWQKNGTSLADGGNVSGAASNVLTLSAVTVADQGSYVLVASNAYGTASSSAATLTVPEPPVITVAPAPLGVQCGSNATFTVTAAGTAPLHYQWSLDGAALTGATDASLFLTNVHLPDHTVAVVVTNLYGSATSSAPLTVSDTLPPIITLNGSNTVYVELGQAWVDPGGTASDLCAGAVAVSASGAVNTAVIGTNLVTYTAADGNSNTNHATRTVIVHDTTPPVITWSFTNLVLAAGSNCTAAMPDVTGTNFIVASDLSGTVLLTQTPTNNAALPLGTNLVLLTVSDASGNRAYSTNWIAVEDQSPPLIVTQPQSQTNLAGSSAGFSVAATACTPLGFQWFFNAAPLAGQTNSSLLIANLTLAAAGDYSVAVTSAGGSATSEVARLTVRLLAPAVTLSSSANPAGFKDSLVFLASVAPAEATGTIQFFTNGAVFEIGALLAGSAATTNLALLPRGTNSVTAVYSGDLVFLPATNEFRQIVTNHPPVAAPAFYTNATNFTLTIAIADLATNWSDVDGDLVSLAGVNPSTNGIVLTNTGSALIYSNPDNLQDEFTCVITDGFGGTNFQTVFIEPAPMPVVTPLITGVAPGTNGTVTLTLGGAPGYTYVLEAAGSLPAPGWIPVATNTLGTTGAWQFNDTQAAGLPQRFYRLRLAP